jgi:hypothetical protein
MAEPVGSRAAFEFWFGALGPSSSSAQSGAGMSLIHTGARFCESAWQSSARLLICAGFGAGSLQAHGQGFEFNQSKSSFYLDARLTALLDVPIVRPWFARVEAGALSPLIRHSLMGEVESGVRITLHRPAVIAPRAAIGIGIGF